MISQTSALQKTIEVVERLSTEEQVHLLDIIYRRLIEDRRNELVNQVAEARQAYQLGQIQQGTVDDLLAEEKLFLLAVGTPDKVY